MTLTGNDGAKVAWEPGRIAAKAGGIEVYKREAMELRTGDRIRWTRNDAGLGLPSLQKLASSRFGWSASKTLDVAQALYVGEGRKILTYPRAEVRYLPENAIADTARIVAGLRAGKSYASVAVPSPPVIRKGRNGAFHDKGLEGASHHAIVPNVNTIGELRTIWPRLTLDEKKLFDVVARSYLAAVMPDYRYQTAPGVHQVGGGVPGVPRQTRWLAGSIAWRENARGRRRISTRGGTKDRKLHQAQHRLGHETVRSCDARKPQDQFARSRNHG